MASVDMQDRVDRFDTFFRDYYEDRIAELAQHYPAERRSLYIDWTDLYQFDEDLAEDVRSHPDQLVAEAEEALRLFDLPVDVSLGQAHVRIRDLPETTDIRDIRAEDVNRLVAVRGIIRKATGVKPRIEEAAFECQRCGTVTRVPQEGGRFQEPHQCHACERKGPFRIDESQSEFVDAQRLRIQESPEGLRGGQTPESIDVHIEDDATGQVSPGDSVRATGVLRLEQQRNAGEESTLFDIYMDGVSVEAEEEQFDEMDITEEDEAEIVALAGEPDVYQKMVDSIAPSIYGYENAKLAMVLQLFSGVTKNLPDGSRTRGDMHLLLIGDPGTGKSRMLQYIRNIAPRSVYTSGKGTTTAGLCVTGDTLVHTKEGFRRIADIVSESIPQPVPTERAVDKAIELSTYNESSGSLESRHSSLIWRMPKKECVRVETERGKTLEASDSTPVLTCGRDGMKWKPMVALQPGDHVAAPGHQNVPRSNPRIEDYFEFTNERLKLSADSIEAIRERLIEVHGTLRNAAADLDLPEDFIYDTLSNRYIPLPRLEPILQSTGLSVTDLTIERAMLRHGDEVAMPSEFDEELCYLIGLIFGDGDMMISARGGNRGRIRISNSDETLLKRARRIFSEKFDKCVEIEYQEDKVPCIRVHSATIARFFRNCGMRTPKTDLELDDRLTVAEHADAFLRGFMDADGSVSARDSGGSSVLVSTISEQFAGQLQLMFESYGVGFRVRERDTRGTNKLPNGYEIETKHVQYQIECYGADIDRYAEAIGFRSQAKRKSLNAAVGDSERRETSLPVGDLLQQAAPDVDRLQSNIARGQNPGRQRAVSILANHNVDEIASSLSEVIDADLRWEEIVKVEDAGKQEVFDLSVPITHNFVANGIVTHNTAAAVRDDFGDGQQWTLEAGALVLADRGIAAVDELDKMAPDDRSALHEGLEAQEISISKAGINATLKARCSLLGAANPQYGRFDQYEPMGEQIDLEPALISRFDLIFTITDRPDAEKDREMAEHILETNYAGELHTRREKLRTPDVSDAEVEEVSRTVTPAIEPDLFRKYVAFAQQSCYPRMTDEARQAIEDFYVDLRSRGADEDAPVPVTARKLEALVRLAEASARVRLSDTVEPEDADRVIELVRSCLQDIGVDPETGQYDADVIETGRSKTQRDRVRSIKDILRELQEEYEEGAPREEVLARAESAGIEREKAEHQIQKLRDQGEVYSPQGEHFRLV